MTAPQDPTPRYRFGKCAAHDFGVRTYYALDTATQRPVLAHLLDDAGPEPRARMTAILAQLPAADAQVVLETLETERGWTIVTLLLDTLESFPAWLAQRVPTMPYMTERRPDTPVPDPTPETSIVIPRPDAG